MKKLYIYFFILSFFYVAACKKALDTAPDGKITLGDIFTDTSKLKALLNTCYTEIPTKGCRYFFWSRGPVVWCDEAWDTDAEAESGLSAGTLYNGKASAEKFYPIDGSADARNGDYWAKYWTSIRNCTLFLTGIDTASAPLDPEVRSRWKGEAHLLRAYYYSELLKWFGPVLPISKSLYKFTDDFSKLKKESYYNVVKFIIEDCDAALNEKFLPTRINNGENYRLTKAVAEALKSKMILFAASPLFNEGKNYWEEAYNTNKISLANLRAMGYELYRNLNYTATYASADAFFGPDNNKYAAIYNEYFTNTMKYDGASLDKETIWESRDNQGNVWDIDGIGAQDGYKAGTCPSQELVDAYETKDGKPILDLANPYLDEKHTQPNYNKDNTMYDPQNPYDNRDPRFYASIYYNGSKRKAWWTFSETPECIENYPAGIGYRTRVIATWAGEPQTGIGNSARKSTRTGYFERKFLHPNAGNSVVTVAAANTKLFRLGEVILNFAEAAAEAGHLDEAAEAVNEIRRRVNMPDLPTGLTKEQLILRVRSERRIELAMEENRYFDLRRWTSPGGDLSKTCKYVTAMEITRNSNGTFTYKRRTVREAERMNYTNKYLLFPVPLDEANRMKSITGDNWQNPGW
ncbi:RagB/SusD family nutrient uptake outer membrane protein [Chitinophaga silvatica]|uniref:RagB/SusD family nutrient uptake outer membrane protein n=1 Tax=Chitinophaga silvatica TaxID=2282649 RepID=A0A3E1Y3T1_9BACT|nr:RagB/SusD family nutrient uptake outer membrane protein [Chitinophaga silvatica]RFS19341.1 RagB/SusD family nutrient uptake outer membrane protein [Chitinophaga silvatica]